MPNKCNENEKQINTCLSKETHQLAKDIAHSQKISLKEVYNNSIQYYANYLGIDNHSLPEGNQDSSSDMLTFEFRLSHIEEAIIHTHFTDNVKKIQSLQKAIADTIANKYNKLLTDLLKRAYPWKYLKKIYDKLKNSGDVEVLEVRNVFIIFCNCYVEDIDELIEEKRDTASKE